MKKIIIAVLCLTFVLCGCSPAVPFYEEELEGLTLETKYNYYFTDDKRVTCTWNNATDKELFYEGEFKLEELKGESWHNVSPKNKMDFSSYLRSVISPSSTSSSLYSLTEFTLEEGTTYRISTYCFDSEGNYYQVYAEFICDNEKANEEVESTMDEYLNS